MKNILLSFLPLFLTGCISSGAVPFFEISSLCNRFYDENRRWPVSENELKEFDLKYSQDKIDWNSISKFCLEKLSDEQIHVAYSIKKWYGDVAVSGSAHRPVITVNPIHVSADTTLDAAGNSPGEPSLVRNIGGAVLEKIIGDGAVTADLMRGSLGFFKIHDRWPMQLSEVMDVLKADGLSTDNLSA